MPVPADFDWRAYLLRYPDLRTAGLRTPDAAARHYAERGSAEHRSYAKVPLVLRYTACQGLFNQMYAHLNALALAAFLGADVVLPPSVYRESFAKYFSMTDLARNEVRWTPAPAGALLDVPALQRHYRERHGIRVLEAPPYKDFPDCMHPQDAFPRHDVPAGVKAEQVVQLPDVYLQSLHAWRLWDRAADAALAKHQALADAGWPADTPVVLDLPCPFLGVMTLTCLDEVQEAAAALRFNRTLVAMARTVIAGMRSGGVRSYNGAHLRLEKDAVDWARVMGGLARYLGAYARAFLAAGFSRSTDVYAASGLLSYNASAEMEQMLAFMAPYSKSVQYKELYLPKQQLAALNPEQGALVDFLVIANADAFVGIGSSTFSAYLREYRVLLGHSRAADAFVDTSKIGSDALFERCTHFAPLDDPALPEPERAAVAEARRAAEAAAPKAGGLAAAAKAGGGAAAAAAAAAGGAGRPAPNQRRRG
jgi:hypothetical protein